MVQKWERALLIAAALQWPKWRWEMEEGALSLALCQCNW